MIKLNIAKMLIISVKSKNQFQGPVEFLDEQQLKHCRKKHKINLPLGTKANNGKVWYTVYMG